MTPETRSYELLFDEGGIRADLKACRERDRYAFSYIIVALGELRANPSTAENFVMVGWQDETVEDVAWIESLQREGINASRVKIWDVKDWRMIFFADHKRRRAALVAVMPRNDNYEKNTILWSRLREAYERLGFERR
ncbi:MAG TPA: hypothetical protein VEZ48_06815 [Sphingomonadaceae bacterium]|nr:hypothetical protein [Sphingomonadaceae bacterium]